MAKGSRDQTLPVVNLADQIMFTNPFPTYAELRRTSPVATVRSQLAPRGGYLLTRYDDVMMLHTDERFSTNVVKWGNFERAARFSPRVFRLLFTESMVFKDDPDHKRLRGLVNKVFTPRVVERMTGDVEKIVGQLIDDMAARGDVDLVRDFAVPLPLAVISEMLGVGEADREDFHVWVTKLNEGTTSAVALLRALRPATRMLRLFERLVEQARSNPNEGLISALVQANEDGDHLSDNELLGMIFLLLLAGHDTTANLIGSATLALIENPDQLALLRERPELIDSAVEELLRYTTPVPCGAARFPTEDVEIAGTTIPMGSAILGMIISANRDPDVFTDPDVLDITRTDNRQLSFAFGAHFCLGNRLARLEARLALSALVQRFSEIELRVPRSALAYKPTQSLRGLRELPLRLS
jgi:cytochrome P450 PksS